jgi:hypothetical protein
MMSMMFFMWVCGVRVEGCVDGDMPVGRRPGKGLGCLDVGVKSQRLMFVEEYLASDSERVKHRQQKKSMNVAHLSMMIFTSMLTLMQSLIVETKEQFPLTSERKNTIMW